jgi:acyl carrier protein
MNAQFELTYKKVKETLISIDSTIETSDLDLHVNLLKEGIIDSFTFIQFVGELEDSFGISFKDDDVNSENFRSLNTVTLFIISITK